MSLQVKKFTATWCGPCKMMAPAIKEIKEEVTDVEIIDIDVEEQEELTKEYNVQSVPTLVLMKDGVEVDRTVGFTPKEALIEWFNTHK